MGDRLSYLDELFNDSADQYARDMEAGHSKLREEMKGRLTNEKAAREASHAGLKDHHATLREQLEASIRRLRAQSASRLPSARQTYASFGIPLAARSWRGKSTTAPSRGYWRVRTIN